MEIRSGERYPAGALSNFSPHHFTFRDVPAASMEGFLQGLKFTNADRQLYVMSLYGRAAKEAGSRHDWHKHGLLYWQEAPIDRFGEEYQSLLDEAFWSLFSQNLSAQRALLASGDAVLKHSLGKRKPEDTVLTIHEFTSRLMNIRERLATVSSATNRRRQNRPYTSG